MIAKRIGAIALTVAMIVGAWLIRSEVIDDDGGVAGNDDPPPTQREIVCVSDLRDACNALADTRADLDIRIEGAGTTLEMLAALERPSDIPIWITMEPFPEMVNSLRGTRGAAELTTETTAVASSLIALVVPIDRAAALAAACGEPLDWVCVGDAAGDSWEDIGGEPSWDDVRPAFAPIDSAIGLLGAADAASGYFGGRPIQPNNDLEFVTWARRLLNAVPASALTGRTAIETIRNRASALDIAIGATAEMTGPSTVELRLQYADPMIRADVVVAVPDGASVPAGLVDDLGRLLVSEGNWDPPSADPNPIPSPIELLAIRTAWKELLS